MKIYTKTGDLGKTGLLGGVRVSKSHLAIRVCGGLDELNSWLGLVRSDKLPNNVDSTLGQIQNDLFELGRLVAGGRAEKSRADEMLLSRIGDLENWIDLHQKLLPELTAFILPGGSRTGSEIHLVRSVCRRCERELVELIQIQERIELSEVLIYINRLSDLLFVMARYVNFHCNAPEIEWSAWP